MTGTFIKKRNFIFPIGIHCFWDWSLVIIKAVFSLSEMLGLHHHLKNTLKGRFKGQLRIKDFFQPLGKVGQALVCYSSERIPWIFDAAAFWWFIRRNIYIAETLLRNLVKFMLARKPWNQRGCLHSISDLSDWWCQVNYGLILYAALWS